MKIYVVVTDMFSWKNKKKHYVDICYLELHICTFVSKKIQI